MSDSTAPLLAALAIVSACVASLVWTIKYLFSQFKPVLDGLVISAQENTNATRNADQYLRQRNGRDMEFHTEVMIALQDIPVQQAKQAEIVAKELKRVGDMTAAKLKVVGDQTIVHQSVEHQVVAESNK